MSMKSGSFAWYDLMTTNPAAAETFYKKVIGWNAMPAGVGDRPYTLLSVGAVNVGGLMPIPPDALAQGATPCWTGYLLVDDVDASATRVEAAGGKIQRPPEDIPGVLRFCIVADPHGAAFILFKGYSTEPPAELAPDAPGNIGWSELHAGDGVSDFAFYSKLFGWTKVQAMDMGPMGTYQTFAMDGTAKAAGGMMTKTPETPAPYWLYYINVEALDTAAARVVEAGGAIPFPAHQVPTGQWIAQCTDPQGARFALLAAKR